jgi:hypothetical protein
MPPLSITKEELTLLTGALREEVAAIPMTE